MVYDDYDEREIDYFSEGPLKLMQKTQEKGLRIKLLRTSREAPPLGPVIKMCKAEITSDLRLIVADRLQSGDDIYNLRRLPQATKRKIAKKIEQHAYGRIVIIK